MAEAPTDAELMEDAAGEAADPPLKVDVSVKSPSACERHVTVTVPREDVERYFDKAYSEMMPTAEVPGFRAGRAPRKLVESRFRKELAPQVKGSLLLDAITQVNDDQKLSAISEPDFDMEAVELPEEGPMVFEYKIEVRPDFELPNWHGLKLERPVREFTEADVLRRKEAILADRGGKLVPKEGAATEGDYVAVELSFHHDGAELSRSDEEVLRIRPTLSFRDGVIEEFDKLMEGAVGGDVRTGRAKISEDAPNAELRGGEVEAQFKVLDVKQLQLPELDGELLESLGGFETAEEFDEFVRKDLQRQLVHRQNQSARQQVAGLLTEAANWDLPKDLLQRQSQRELERAVLELRRNGFTEQEIRAHSNELRQNAMSSTARSLKEHFILERIAEEENIEESPEDFDAEIAAIAAQSMESPRRVRARLEKQGLMDVLGNQIRERKVLERIYSQAEFTDTPLEDAAGKEVEAVDQSAAGGEEEAAIPEVAEEADAGKDYPK